MRTSFLAGILVTILLAGCSRQDQDRAREDAHRAGQKIREGAKDAGREIKKDLKKADQQLQESMEKGKVAAQHAAKELRKELNDDREPAPKRARDRQTDKE